MVRGGFGLKFGDNYLIVNAYETRALNWPEVRAEDSISLDRFSIFLMRCKYTIIYRHRA